MTPPRWWLSVALLASILLAQSSLAEAVAVCAGKDATLKCLKRNFRSLYETDPKRFWELMHAAERRALLCDSPDETREFLEATGLIKGSTEMAEYFHEVIQRMFLKWEPRCFLDALVKADTESKRVIVDYFLKHPMYRKDEVRETLSRYRNIRKYRDLMNRYFGD